MPLLAAVKLMLHPVGLKGAGVKPIGEGCPIPLVPMLGGARSREKYTPRRSLDVGAASKVLAVSPRGLPATGHARLHHAKPLRR
jgi:hypothetical protein